MKLIFCCGAMLLSLLLSTEYGSGQVHSYSLAAPTDENSKPIWKRFRTEGGLSGTDLILFNDSTYQFSIYTDIPPDLPPSYGRYRLDSNFITVLGMKFLGGYIKDVTFLLTKWGKMEVLLEKDELTNICNQYNHGYFILRDTSDFLFRGGIYHNASAPRNWFTGKPELPPPWNHYLLSNPIHARVTRIDTITFEIWINKGSIDSAYLGLELFAPNVRANMTITKLSVNESKCEPSDELGWIYSLARRLLSLVDDSLRQNQRAVQWQRRDYLKQLQENIGWLQSDFSRLDTNTYLSSSLRDSLFTKPR